MGGNVVQEYSSSVSLTSNLPGKRTSAVEYPTGQWHYRVPGSSDCALSLRVAPIRYSISWRQATPLATTLTLQRGTDGPFSEIGAGDTVIVGFSSAEGDVPSTGHEPCTRSSLNQRQNPHA